MFQNIKPHLAIIALVVANLFPLAGVVLWDWDAGFLLLVYWAENLVIGFYNILKMLSASVQKASLFFGILFNIAFFSIHYGGFVGVHGMFLLEYLNFGEGSIKDMMTHTWPGPLVFLELLKNVIAYIFSFMTFEMLLALTALLVSHGVSFVTNFIAKAEFKTANPKKLMMSPYGRIFVMHVVIIAGGVLIMKSGSAMPMLMLLVALKIAMDVYLHQRSHRKMKQQPA